MDMFKYLGLNLLLILAVTVAATTYTYDSTYDAFTNSDAFNALTSSATTASTDLQDENQVFVQQGDQVQEQGSGGFSIVLLFSLLWNFLWVVATGIFLIVSIAYAALGLQGWLAGLFAWGTLLYMSISVGYFALELYAWFRNKDTK